MGSRVRSSEIAPFRQAAHIHTRRPCLLSSPYLPTPTCFCTARVCSFSVADAISCRITDRYQELSGRGEERAG